MQFEIHAIDRGSRSSPSRWEAASEDAALAAAQQQASRVLGKSLEARKVLRVLLKRRAAFPTMLFSLELMALLNAGLNLVEALSTLAEKDSNADSGTVLKDILAAIRCGEPFSQAIGAFRSSSRRSTSRPSRRASAPATCARRSAATSPTRRNSTACAKRSSPRRSTPRS